MGKGHSTASKIGIMNFHLKAIHYGPGDNPHDCVYTVLLPVLICNDFDTDIIILSGPMLNQSGFGIGPLTNYIASTEQLRAYPVESKYLIERHTPFVDVFQKANGIPYVVMGHAREAARRGAQERERYTSCLLYTSPSPRD